MMKKIENEKEVLALFVDNNVNRNPRFNDPFLTESGFVVGTDCSELIAIRKECTSGAYKTIDTNVSNRITDMIQGRNCDHAVSIFKLEEALNIIPKEEETITRIGDIECPECHGTREVTAAYYCKYDDCYHDISGECPICNGDGRIEGEIAVKTGAIVPSMKWVIQVGEVLVRTKYINKLVKLCKMIDVNEVRVVKLAENDNCIAMIGDDIHVVMHSLHPDFYDKYAKNIVKLDINKLDKCERKN